MQAYQERVIEEKRDLDVKLSKLVTFLSGDSHSPVPYEELARLTRQAKIMQSYSEILGERIAYFKRMNAEK